MPLLAAAAAAVSIQAQVLPGDRFIPSDHPLHGVPLYRNAIPYHLARLTPARGPDAAPTNPARLAEAAHWSSQISGSNAGRVDVLHTGGAAALPGGVALGFSAIRIRGSALGTDVMFHDQRAAFQLAWRYGGSGTGPGLSIGYSLVARIVNGWNYYRETDLTHDVGLAWRPSGKIGGWSPDFGLALRDLVPLFTGIPDDSTGVPSRYRIQPRNAEATLGMDSPAGFVSAWLSIRAEERAADGHDVWNGFPSSGPGIGYPGFKANFNRYGFSVRPWDFLSVRLETPGYGTRLAGITLDARRWLGWRLQADAAVAEGAFYSYSRPLESGLTWAWAVRAGW